MELKNILLEKEGEIAIVTINRPKALNALNSETLNDIYTVVSHLEGEKDVYAVILRGAGDKSFVAGADIAEMKDLNEEEGRKFGVLGNRVFRKLENLDKPVIAAISGFALGGGCELAISELQVKKQNLDNQKLVLVLHQDLEELKDFQE